MSILTFKGGVHPLEGKELSKNRPIKAIVPKGELVFPLSQHIGAPAIPIVEIGEKVFAGQKIAEAGGFISANIHSSVSGTVKAIEPRLTVAGTKVMSIVIESDGEFTTLETDMAEWLLENFTKQNIREVIKEAGIVGMGGACFPTNVKLTPKDDDAIEYVIVNGAECEPYLTSDYRRLIETPQKVIEGLKTILLLFDNAQGIIAIEDNKKDAIVKISELVKDEPRITVKALYTKYPQGSERQLIYAVTGRKINSSMLPADAGCVVDNVDTVCAVYEAVRNGQPLTSRIVTVTGYGIKEPQNFLVPIGTSHAQLIEEAGGLTEECEKIVSGGPMMGTALFDLNVPVVKGSSAILCIIKDEVKSATQTNCINCGKCVEVCPENLVCTKLATFAEAGNTQMFEKYYGMECMECGSCSFICPAKRNITQAIKSMKKDIIAQRRRQA
ncbi:MAG: electron transport complex subunit RsxC [Eubacterium sp.]